MVIYRNFVLFLLIYTETDLVKRDLRGLRNRYFDN